MPASRARRLLALIAAAATATATAGFALLPAAAAAGSGPPATVPISVVQGSGATSPLVGTDVTVRGVVTSLRTSRDQLGGFTVQAQAPDQDGDPGTSEALYVSCDDACPADLSAGELVTVSGVVTESFGRTGLDPVGPVRVAGTAPLPAAAAVRLPAATSTRDSSTFEPLENMRVTIPDALTLDESFNLARFGELVLSSGGRPYQFTHLSTPDAAGLAAYEAALATRRIILDDGSEDQNDATSGAADEAYPYPTPGLRVTNRFRAGDTISGLTAVMDFAFGAWRLQPVPGADYAFSPAGARPAAPPPVGGRLRVASFNVLNYFADIDQTSSGSSGPCGPDGTLDCRGADSERERVRQLDKIVPALLGLDADVVGLIEIQNDSGAATEQVVRALNAATAPGRYASIRTGSIGTDAIKLAILYRPASVRPAGAFATLTSADDPRFVDTRNRPALVQSFDEVATGERFTLALNHFKSKGSSCGAGDDAVDGSGNCDATRTQAAQALVEFLDGDPTASGDPDVLVVGDLNAYRNERPVTTLTGAGYTDLIRQRLGEDAYSFLFDGQLGYLDHALATASLARQVSGVAEWHIDADEPTLLDYNDDVLDAGESAFERRSSALPLYAADAYRASDHDPVLVGLDLGATPARTPSPAPTPTGTAVPRPPVCSVPSTVELPLSTVTATQAAPVVVTSTPNSVVELLAYTQPSTTYRVARRAVVGADGAARFLVVPPRNTRLYAQQVGCRTEPASASVVLNVRTALSLSATRQGARRYLFTGDSLPARPGGLLVSLYRLTGTGGGVLTAQARARAADGEWAIDRRFTGTGTYRFLARTGQDMQNAPGSSAELQLTLR